MKLVKISHVCLRGLIQLRNDLVYHISSNELPSELKNDERACSKCSQLRACSLLRKTNQQQDDIELYDKSIEHLTRAHKDFFYKWYDMLELEFGNSEYKQFESGELVWWKDKKDLEATGFAVFDLKIDLTGGHSGDQRVGQEEGFTIDRFFLFEFVKANGNYTKPIKMTPLEIQGVHEVCTIFVFLFLNLQIVESFLILYVY